MNTEQPIGKVLQERRQTRGLTQEQLARKAEVPYTTLTKVESGAIKNPSMQLVWKLSRALDITLDSLLTPKVFHGDDSLREIWSDALSSMSPGDYMCITGVDESQFLQIERRALLKFIDQLKRRELQQKLICCKGDTQFLPGDHLEYRSIAREYFNPTPVYVYADRIAFLIWGPPTQALIIQNSFLADAFRKQFLFIWEHAEPIKRRSSKTVTSRVKKK